MKKINVGVDIDDTVAEFAKSYFKFYNFRYNTRHNFRKLRNYSFRELTGDSREDELRNLGDFYESDFFDGIEVVEGSQEALHSLSKKNNIFFVSARDPRIEQKTHKFLSRNFSGIDYRLILSGDAFHNGKKSKVEICVENDIEVIIEDLPKYAQNCANADIISLLLQRRKWSRDYLPHDNLIPVGDWNKAIKVIDSKFEVKNG